MKVIIRYILFLFIGLSIGIAGTVIHYKHSEGTAISDSLPRISAPKLYEAYRANEQQSNKKYLNQPLEINGIVEEVYQTHDGELMVQLHSNNKYRGVTCKLENTAEQVEQPLKLGSNVTMQGYCFGMDKNVRMFHCVLIN